MFHVIFPNFTFLEPQIYTNKKMFITTIPPNNQSWTPSTNPIANSDKNERVKQGNHQFNACTLPNARAIENNHLGRKR